MESDYKPKLKNIETFTDDMVRVLESEKGGLIKKIIHEEEERELQKKNLSPESARNKIFMLVGLFLFMMAIGGLFSSFMFKENVLTAPVEPQFTPLIFADKTSFLDISKTTSKSEIATLFFNRALGAEVKIGGIEGIHFSEQNNIIGLKSFLTKIQASYPQEGFNVLSQSFLPGVFQTKENTKHPFFLLKVRSFTDVFPKMLVWEEKMFADLANFFGITIDADNIYLSAKPFEDKFIANKNARVLYDNNGEIVMMYVFTSPDSVLITNNIATSREIMLRLLSGKIKK